MAAVHESWIDDTIVENDESIAEWMTGTGTTPFPATGKPKLLPPPEWKSRQGPGKNDYQDAKPAIATSQVYRKRSREGWHI
jgi:hypothetical protein